MKSALCSAIALVLVACAGAPAPPQPPPPAPPKVMDAKAQKIDLLLQRADTALSLQALTEPAAENAFDLYRSVLLLDATNIRAQEGIKNVATAFPAQVEEAIAGKQYDAALRKLQRGLILFPANVQLKQMEQQVKAAKQARVAVASQSPIVPLAVSDLTAKSAIMETNLKAIAKKVGGNQMVIINARNDAEGRWIYKTMRDGLATRLRGDIKISGSPSIQIVPLGP